MVKILILGASGFIGRHLLERFRGNPHYPSVSGFSSTHIISWTVFTGPFASRIITNKTYTLEEINEALDDLETGKVFRPLITLE